MKPARKTKTADVLKLRSTVKKAMEEQRRWACWAAAVELMHGHPIKIVVEAAETIREYTMNGVVPGKAPASVTPITSTKPF
jgi:hypothetical protein